MSNNLDAEMKAIRLKLAREIDKLEGAVGAALYQFANIDIRTPSQKLCPVETSTLKRSCYVTKPKRSGKELLVIIGYGTIYALAVHEMPATNNFTKQGTGPKYLEKPFKAAMGGFTSKLNQYAKKNYASGVLMRDVVGNVPGGE